MKQKFNVDKLVFSIGIILQVFGGVYQPLQFGYLASSPGNLLLLCAGVFSLDSIKTNAAARLGWLLIISGLAASLISLFEFGHNLLYVQKTINLCILNILWITPLLCSDLIDKRWLKKSIVISLIICGIAVIVSDLYPVLFPGSLRQIVFTERISNYWDDRVRGFMTETSHFAWLVSRYSIIYVLLDESGKKYNAYRYIGSLILIAVLLILIGSKGAALGIGLTLLSIILDKKRWYFALFLLPVAVGVFLYQIDGLLYDVENRTSTATRLGLGLASLYAFFDNPLGWGYYGFYGVLREAGTKAVGVISDLGLNPSEILRITDEFDSVSFKSSIADYIAVNGVVFLYFITRIILRIDYTDPRGRSGLLFFIISGFSCSGNETIGFSLGCAVLLKFYGKQQVGGMM